MADYILKPGNKRLPSATFLLEEIHKRGIPVEINVTGTVDQWEAIRFFEPGPPEIECFATFDQENPRFILTVPKDSPELSSDLRLLLAHIFLSEVGGTVTDSSTGENYDAPKIAARVRQFQPSKSGISESLWLIFSWAVLPLAALAYFAVPHQLRILVIGVAVLAFFSAVGQTYSKLKS